jgi:hypothetical protein
MVYLSVSLDFWYPATRKLHWMLFGPAMGAKNLDQHLIKWAASTAGHCTALLACQVKKMKYCGHCGKFMCQPCESQLRHLKSASLSFRSCKPDMHKLYSSSFAPVSMFSHGTFVPSNIYPGWALRSRDPSQRMPGGAVIRIQSRAASARYDDECEHAAALAEGVAVAQEEL